jgi:hypothetical protein
MQAQQPESQLGLYSTPLSQSQFLPLPSPTLTTMEPPVNVRPPSRSQPQSSEATCSPPRGSCEPIGGSGQHIQTMTELEPGETIISRLWGTHGRFNDNTPGKLRYFGPTSSLHLTDSVTSIFLYCNDISRSGPDIEKDIPWAMQQYLLDLYWKYHHDALHVIHKGAFLAGMEAGQSPYFSRCLLLCVLASGARCSVSPNIRAMAVSVDASDPSARPILTRQAEEALEKELQSPGVTTIQSLMLLSNLDCCHSNDSRGWMRMGKIVYLHGPTADIVRTCLPAGLRSRPTPITVLFTRFQAFNCRSGDSARDSLGLYWL